MPLMAWTRSRWPVAQPRRIWPVAGGNVPLKNELDADLLLLGCGELARHLVRDGVVDELWFWLHPAVGAPAHGLSRTTPSGCGCSTPRRTTRASSCLRYEPTALSLGQLACAPVGAPVPGLKMGCGCPVTP